MFFSKRYEDNSGTSDILKNKFSLKLVDRRVPKTIEKTSYYSLSETPREYLQNVGAIGSVLARPDKDGVIRKIEPIFLYENNYYPSLALAVYQKIKGGGSFELNEITLQSDKLKLPIHSKNVTYSHVKWYRPLSKEQISSHELYSAWKLIESHRLIKEGKEPIIAPSVFKNKVVVVGATASTLNDIKVTPMGADYPGVDIQATFIDNFLHNEFITHLPVIVRILICIGIIAATVYTVILLEALHSTILLTIFMLAYFHICIWSYSNNVAIDVITPEVFIVCSLAVGYAYRYFLEGQKKEMIQQAMGKYVSKDVMTNILKNINDVKPGGERAELTILFSDIRNFTAISESLEPEAVSAILNEYFSEMVPIITKYNGVINKFVGDALLVVFGAPISDPIHPLNSILCAIEMLEKVDELQEKWLKQGKSKVEIGIGVNTGIAFVGNIGSQDRLEYTVIGDTVNVASRIESYNKLYGTRLLISDTTYQRVKEKVDVIRISSVSIKGKAEKMDIYEIIEILSEKQEI